MSNFQANIAIVGRPNVGKSSLFNRLIGRKRSSVKDTPGITRDRQMDSVIWKDNQFSLTDTAGYDSSPTDTLSRSMNAQTLQAISDADLVLFVVDVKAGLLPDDTQLAELLRTCSKFVVVVGHKAENLSVEQALCEFYALGFEQMVPVSSVHGEGINNLINLCVHTIKHSCQANSRSTSAPSLQEKPLHVALLGKPNVGKSSLINALVGDQRVLTGEQPHVTRDSVCIKWFWKDTPITLYDTAGVRRRKTNEALHETLFIQSTLRTIRYAEVVILVLDATQPFEHQDLSLIDYVFKEGRALVLALNKWDCIEQPHKVFPDLQRRCLELLPQIKGVPLIKISARQQSGLDDLMKACFRIHKLWNIRISTPILNGWLPKILNEVQPPMINGQRIKPRYITQIKSRPPHFVLCGSRVDQMPIAYQRYLLNQLRKHFQLPGVPLRLSLKTQENPYAKKSL